MNINQFIKFNGTISTVDFMNSLGEKINDEFKTATLEVSKKSLKFIVTFECDKNAENEEEKRDSKMLVELFKYGEGRYLLEFRRIGGIYPIYYHNFMKIKEIITNNIFIK